MLLALSHDFDLTVHIPFHARDGDLHAILYKDRVYEGASFKINTEK
jgi:hypothetical protein